MKKGCDIFIDIQIQNNFAITGGAKIDVGASLLANRATKIASKLAPTINDHHLLRSHISENPHPVSRFQHPEKRSPLTFFGKVIVNNECFLTGIFQVATVVDDNAGVTFFFLNGHLGADTGPGVFV